MKNLKLDQLRTFAAVIDLGGFSSAAERMGLTQPAVSLQVRQLEERVGVKLIERTGRTLQPTAAGSELLVHAARVEAEVAAAAEAMTRFLDDGAGRVRLGTGATACIHMLPPVLRRLRRALPRLEIVVAIDETPETVRAVEENAIDIGFVSLPATAGRSLVIEDVVDDELVAVSSPEAATAEDPSPEALAALPLILYENRGSCRRQVDSWFAGAGITPKPAMSLGNVEAIKAMVRVGLGHAVLPASAVRSTGGGEGLVYRSLRPRLFLSLATVVRRDKRLTRALRETLSALRALRDD